jgi:hypothetical protein
MIGLNVTLHVCFYTINICFIDIYILLLFEDEEEEDEEDDDDEGSNNDQAAAAQAAFKQQISQVDSEE